MPILAGKYIWSSGCVELVPIGINEQSQKKFRAKQLINAMLHSLRADSLNKSISIAKYAHCLRGAKLDFAGLNTALVAHFDPEDNIDPTLIKQCQHLKKLGYKVVLCTSSELSAKKALESTQDFAHAIIYRNCAGYDFTSWKAAFTLFPSLWQCSELILTNDSYFGPLSLKNFENGLGIVHKRMQDFTCDFWGISFSWQQVPHIQSYYMVIKPQVLQSEALKKFFDAVPLCPERKTAIAQELSFTLWLALHGFKPAAFCFALGSKAIQKVNPSLHGHEVMLKRGVSIIKREAVRSPHGFTTLLKYCAIQNSKLQQNTEHDIQFYNDFLTIENYFLRVQKGPNLERGTGQHGKHFPPYVASKFKPLELEPIDINMNLTQGLAVLIYVKNVQDLELIKHLNHLPQGIDIYALVASEQTSKPLPTALTCFNIKLLPSNDEAFTSLLSHAKLLEKYSFILQLQVNSLALSDLCGSGFEEIVCKRWQEHIYTSLLGSKERVAGIIHSMQSTKLGCIAPMLYPPFLRTTQGEHAKIINYMASKMGFDLPMHVAIDYPLGGMFWANVDMLKPLIKLFQNHEPELKSICSPLQLNASVEKMLFISCALQGLHWSRVSPT